MSNLTKYNKIRHIHFLVAIFACVFIISSCNTNNSGTIRETPTRGDIKLLVDESFKTLLQSSIDVFTSIYEDAYITPIYESEPDVINDFLRDTAKVMVVSKPLNESQVLFLNDSLIFPVTTPYFTDAVAFIVSKDNSDTLIRYKEMEGIIKGSFTRWDDLTYHRQSTQPGGIRIILDDARSGNIRFLKEVFNIEGTLPSNFFALENSEEIFDFVARNKDAMGIVSAAYLSNKQNPEQAANLKKINVVSISQPDTDEKTFYRPSQASLMDGDYPFSRQVYFISRESFPGLGTGFVQFATSEQGQRIVLRSGLLPATIPTRVVKMP